MNFLYTYNDTYSSLENKYLYGYYPTEKKRLRSIADKKQHLC